MFGNLSAQDTIVKRDHERIICKIKEIGTDEIKYQPLTDNLIIGIDKNKVEKVILASGIVMNFHNSMDDMENYKDNNKNCLKLTLLSPLWGYTGISYEHSIKPGSSFECSLGIIGLGRNVNDSYGGSGVGNNGGVTIRIGYKFIKTPDFYLKGIQYAHVLKGLYFRPELILTDFNHPTSTYVYMSSNQTSTTNILNGAILFNMGYQWIFNNTVVVDMFFGLGYGFGSMNSLNNSGYYGYGIISSNEPLAISTGFRIGFLFK